MGLQLLLLTEASRLARLVDDLRATNNHLRADLLEAANLLIVYQKPLRLLNAGGKAARVSLNAVAPPVTGVFAPSGRPGDGAPERAGGATDGGKAARVSTGLPLLPPHLSSLAREPDGLTAAELRVLVGIAGGYSYGDIAHQHGLTNATVRNHATNIFAKIYVRDRINAAIYAWRSGIVDPREAWDMLALSKYEQRNKALLS